MGKLRTIRLLILEDDLRTLSSILEVLANVEDRLVRGNSPRDLSITVISEYTQVERYINSSVPEGIDVILLDRDCKMGGSFHVLDVKKFGPDKVIAMSTVPDYNARLKQLGVTRIIDKTYEDLDTFALKIGTMVENMLG